MSFKSVLSCLDNMDEGPSLRLKDLLSDYFDKRRERDLTLEPLEPDDSLQQYKVTQVLMF